MRRLTPVEMVLAVFWMGYAIIAGCVLYAAAEPATRVLLLILAGYAIALAPVILIVLWQAGRMGPRGHSAP